MKKTSFVIAAWLMALNASVSYASPGAHGPNGEHLDAAPSASASGLARLPDGSVNIPKLSQRRMEIRTLMPSEAELAKSVRLNATVEIDPNTGGIVQAPFAGAISAPSGGFPVLGKQVRQGEKLVRIRPVADGLTLSNQQARLAEINTELELAKGELSRLEKLQGTTPRKELEAASLRVKSLSSQRNTLSQTLNAGQWLTSPVDGVIAASNVLNGEIVQPGQALFTVIDPTRTAITAQVASAQTASSITGGTVEGMPSVSLALQGAAIALSNGKVPVRFEAKSTQPDNRLPLAIGQPVTVIATLRETASGIKLPTSSLVRNQNNEVSVWIKAGAERFVALPVEYQPLNASEIVITKGLSADNRVVVSGASLISQIR